MHQVGLFTKITKYEFFVSINIFSNFDFKPSKKISIFFIEEEFFYHIVGRFWLQPIKSWLQVWDDFVFSNAMRLDIINFHTSLKIF